MGIAKTVPSISTEPIVVSPQKPVDPITVAGESPLHSEVYKYFGKAGIETPELKEISDWAFRESSSVSQALNKIRSLEMKLGQPNGGETRLNKLSNWIRMDRNMKNTSVTFKEELSSVQNRFKNEIAEINKTKGERLAKVKGEIERIENDYKKVYSTLRNRTKTEMDRLKLEYNRQLKELKGIRKAYEGVRL